MIQFNPPRLVRHIPSSNIYQTRVWDDTTHTYRKDMVHVGILELDLEPTMTIKELEALATMPEEDFINLVYKTLDEDYIQLN